ncbi:MAG: hypothetical protein MK212_05215 [Saprospiraceae bacterium]|nr:hypothetical protein [Saprospiraceae bacterium]
MFENIPSTTVQTPIASAIFYPSKNYLHVTFTATQATSMDLVLTHLKHLNQLVGDAPPPLFLADIRKTLTVSKEVRDMLGNHPLAVRVASKVAILINSSVTRILGNLFVRFSKPPYPSKLFTSEDKALEWLFE